MLLSELSSLKSGSCVYEGAENSVMFMEDVNVMKSRITKKQALLKKKCTKSDALAF